MGLLKSRPIFISVQFGFCPTSVQNLPQSLRDSLVVTAGDVRVRVHCEPRVAVAESLLPNLHRHRESIHQRSVRLAKGVKPARANAEGAKQRIRRISSNERE